MLVVDFQYVQSTPAYVKQKVTGNRTPKRSFAGGNGTFLMPGTPPKILITFHTNSQYILSDIYKLVKQNCKRRVTKKYATQICTSLLNKPFSDYESFANFVISIL